MLCLTSSILVIPGTDPHQQGTVQFMGFANNSATDDSNASPSSVGNGVNVTGTMVGETSVDDGIIVIGTMVGKTVGLMRLELGIVVSFISTVFVNIGETVKRSSDD